ncbi:MAG: hypothetical protein ACYCZF_18330 [Anaerolineae bacterium]
MRQPSDAIITSVTPAITWRTGCEVGVGYWLNVLPGDDVLTRKPNRVEAVEQAVQVYGSIYLGANYTSLAEPGRQEYSSILDLVARPPVFA